jgi:hypothetical protein
VLRLAALGVLLGGLLQCSDPLGPRSVTAYFDAQGFLQVAQQIPIPADELFIELRRVSDSSVAFSGSTNIDPTATSAADSLVVEVTVELMTSPEEFFLYAVLRGGGVEWFEVRDTVVAFTDQVTDTPPLAPTYIGPGADGTSLIISLTDTTITGGDSILVSGTVLEGQTAVPEAPVGFESSDIAKVAEPRQQGRNQAWVVAPRNLTDFVTITGTALTRTGSLTASGILRFYAPAAELIIVSGDGQQVLPGQQAPEPLVVQVLDAAGNPFTRGFPVTFALAADPGGTTLSAGSVTTDAQGLAQVTVTAGDVTGSIQVTATAAGLTGSPQTFNLTVGAAGAPDVLLIVSGDGQTADAGTMLLQPLVVEVRDQSGFPVPGVTVDWTTGNGTLSASSTVTDAAGRSQVNWTLGSGAIDQTATASVTGITPVVFNATATFPMPTILLALVGTNRVPVGGSVDLLVTLSEPAGVGGVDITVTSDNTGILTVASASSAVVSIPQGQTTGMTTVEGVTSGVVTVRGSATGFVEGTLDVTVSVQVLSMPTTLNVPFGGTASLPVQISTPAPVGGVTVTLVSGDPAVVAVLTPTVTVPEGLQTANGTVSGVFPGTATVTGTTADFGSAQSSVSTTANLNIIQSSVGLNESFGENITIQLESGGSAIPAPTGGIAVTLTADDPGCVAAPSPVTIPDGLVDVTATSRDQLDAGHGGGGLAAVVVGLAGGL